MSTVAAIALIFAGIGVPASAPDVCALVGAHSDALRWSPVSRRLICAMWVLIHILVGAILLLAGISSEAWV